MVCFRDPGALLHLLHLLLPRYAETMNIALTDHFEKLIRALIKSRRYNIASEVVRAGLRSLEQREMPVLPAGSLRGLYTRAANAAERKTAQASVTKVDLRQNRLDRVAPIGEKRLKFFALRRSLDRFGSFRSMRTGSLSSVLDAEAQVAHHVEQIQPSIRRQRSVARLLSGR